MKKMANKQNIKKAVHKLLRNGKNGMPKLSKKKKKELKERILLAIKTAQCENT